MHDAAGITVTSAGHILATSKGGAIIIALSTDELRGFAAALVGVAAAIEAAELAGKGEPASTPALAPITSGRWH